MVLFVQKIVVFCFASVWVCERWVERERERERGPQAKTKQERAEGIKSDIE